MPQSQRKYQLLAKWAWLNFLWIIFVWKVINKPCIKGKLTSAFYKKNDSLRSHFSLSLSLWLNPKKTKKYRWMYLRAEFVNSQTPIIIKLWILRNNDFTVWNTQSCSFFPFFKFDVLFFFFFCFLFLWLSLASHLILYSGQFSRSDVPCYSFFLVVVLRKYWQSIIKILLLSVGKSKRMLLFNFPLMRPPGEVSKRPV